ncbi:MAG: ferrous iron transport protein A [Chthoniobacterales bacterium]
MSVSSIKESFGMNPLQSLAEAQVGLDFQIRCLEGQACEPLRKLGFCESLKIRKLSNGRNMICSICGTRLALSRDLADQVKVATPSI